MTDVNGDIIHEGEVCTNCSKILLGEQRTMLRTALQCNTFYRQLGAASIIIIPGPQHLGWSAKGWLLQVERNSQLDAVF